MAGFLGGAILGSLVGAGLAMLVTPRSGEETRRRLAEWREARRASPQPSNPAEELLELGAAVAQEIVQRVEFARQAAAAAREQSRQQLTAEWEASLRGEPGELAKNEG
jgi:gas vesicle protein